MYPGPEVLQEVGRVTIAGSRLDVQMAFLWHHLDRTIELEEARRAPGWKQCERVLHLASERLTGAMQEQVTAAVEAAKAARRRRNEIVHQDWVLIGSDAMRPVRELAEVTLQEWPAYGAEWDREAKDSRHWQRVPARTVEPIPIQTLEELREVERELAAAADQVSALTLRVASSRETGMPPGYRHPTVVATASDELLAMVEELADWSPWVTFDVAAETAPRLPGVYMARHGADGPVVYIGRAGDRKGKGLRGRLGAYASGKGMVSGLGEAATDRALADAQWLRERLVEIEHGNPSRATAWARAALARAGLYVRWATQPRRWHRSWRTASSRLLGTVTSGTGRA